MTCLFLSRSYDLIAFVVVASTILCLGLKHQKQPPEVFYKKVVLKKFAKFTGKYLCLSLSSNMVAGSVTLLKNRLRNWCFPAQSFNNYRLRMTEKELCFLNIFRVYTWTSLDRVT